METAAAASKFSRVPPGRRLKLFASELWAYYGVAAKPAGTFKNWMLSYDEETAQ
jgi:hypothetical protein